jgi:hypothetical protein
VGVKNGLEIGTLGYSVHGSGDRILKGHAFLKDLLEWNTVLAASGMARRECYERLSFFPLDVVWAGTRLNMLWGGDWYLWCLFALHYDVGYFAEPMVCYREHDLSMTTVLMQGDVEKCSAAEVAVPWMIRHKAKQAGYRHVSRNCLYAAANEYARSIASTKRYGTSGWHMTLDQFEDSLFRNAASNKERTWVRARVYAGIADQYYWRGELPLAKQFYWAGLQKDPRMIKAIVKWLFLSLGAPGGYLRKTVGRFRSLARSIVLFALDRKQRI